MTTNEKRYPALEDTDKMPWGKHKDELMQDVPTSYLKYLYDDMCKTGGYDKQNTNVKPEDVIRLEATNRKWLVDRWKVFNYLWNSMDAIKMELGEK